MGIIAKEKGYGVFYFWKRWPLLLSLLTYPRKEIPPVLYLASIAQKFGGN
jgi:hypothetical protein